MRAIDWLINELKFIKVSEKHNEKLWSTIEKAREMDKANIKNMQHFIDSTVGLFAIDFDPKMLIKSFVDSQSDATSLLCEDVAKTSSLDIKKKSE